jgi:hypothetical protein
MNISFSNVKPLFKIKYIVVGSIFVSLTWGLFTYIIMTDSLAHDEHMYIAAGVLAQNKALYQDFAYLQMPYLPLAYTALYQLIGSHYYLLTGRLLNFISMTLSAILIYLISYRITKSLFVATSVMLLLVWNETIIKTMWYFNSSIMPMTFSLLGFYLFLISLSKWNVNRLGTFLSGVCLAIATGTKLYYAVTLIPFLMVALLYPVSLSYRKRIFTVFLPIVAGFIVGLGPVWYYLFTDFEVREITGYHRSMTFGSKLRFGWEIWSYPTNVVISIGVLYPFLIRISNGLQRQERLNQFLSHWLHMECLLSILLVLVTTTTIITPTPLWPWYFMMPISFTVIFLSCCSQIIDDRHRYGWNVLLICLLILSFVFGGGRLIKSSVTRWQNVNDWKPIVVHRVAEQISEHIDVSAHREKVATLSPIYILEASLPIYDELSTGPFLYRVGDLIPDNKRTRLVGTSPNDLQSLFKVDPPKAIFVGFQDDLDAPFIEYAQENNYVKIEKDFDGGTLYVRRDK